MLQFAKYPTLKIKFSCREGKTHIFTVTFTLSYFITLLPQHTHSDVSESRPPAVVYETVSDVVTPTGPDTSENVAYGVSHSLPTTTQHNPAYGHITPNK
jgi:hypothetical protein